MDLKLAVDPLFGSQYNWFPGGPGAILVMPKDKGTASYYLSDEAVTKLNSGHRISPAKLAKLQQIARFKAKGATPTFADIKLSHL